MTRAVRRISSRTGSRQLPAARACARRRRGAPRRSSSARGCAASARRPPAAGRGASRGAPSPAARSRRRSPRLSRSPARPASAPMAKEPAYQSGCEQAGPAVQLAHARLAPGQVVGLVARRLRASARGRPGCGPNRAWPWYSAWAAISPAWLTRISAAACAGRSGSCTDSGGRPGGVRAGPRRWRRPRCAAPRSTPGSGGRRGPAWRVFGVMDTLYRGAGCQPRDLREVGRMAG